MKKFVLSIVLGVTLSGCAQTGYVKAENIKGLVDAVTARHDAYVKADPTYAGNEAKRGSDLQSSEILRAIVQAALAADAPAPVTTK